MDNGVVMPVDDVDGIFCIIDALVEVEVNEDITDDNEEDKVLDDTVNEDGVGIIVSVDNEDDD